jgi:hypothetical protein
MSDNPSVYLIDDEKRAIDLFNTLKKIEGFQEAVSMSLRDAFPTKDKTVEEVAGACVEKIMSDDSPLCIVFLDLALALQEKIGPEARADLRKKLHLEQVYASDAPDPYQGLAVGNRIIELLPEDFSKRLLFLIQTKGSEVPVPRVDNPRILFGRVATLLASFDLFAADKHEYLDALAQMKWGDIKAEKARRLIMSFSAVDGFFEGPYSAKWWMSRWLLHEDLYIANLLNEYFDPFRAGTPGAWTHDWIEHNDGLEAGGKIIGATPDIESNKALFMREFSEVSFISTEPVSRDLDPALLASVLERLDIQAELIGMEEESLFKLPAMPGIAFLLGLKVLLNELSKEAPAERVEFSVDGTSYSVRVVLGDHKTKGQEVSRRGHRCVRRFLDKLHDAGTGQTTDGVSGTVYDAAHCRLRGLRNPEEESWVTMFEDGLPHWAAWPSFVEDGIEFRW